eukprot:6213168-Pleurochrysis_carterae.AAC.1
MLCCLGRTSDVNESQSELEAHDRIGERYLEQHASVQTQRRRHPRRWLFRLSSKHLSKPAVCTPQISDETLRLTSACSYWEHRDARWSTTAPGRPNPLESRNQDDANACERSSSMQVLPTAGLPWSFA